MSHVRPFWPGTDGGARSNRPEPRLPVGSAATAEANSGQGSAAPDTPGQLPGSPGVASLCYTYRCQSVTPRHRPSVPFGGPMPTSVVYALLTLLLITCAWVSS